MSQSFNAMSHCAKTRLCKFYKVGCKNASCTFAHSKEELKPRVCSYDENCKNYNCTFFHPSFNPYPNSDDLMYKASIGMQFVEKLEKSGTSPPPNSPVDLKDKLTKTKLCKYYKVGCSTENCTFAHSKEELKVRMCNFGDNCRKSNCTFYHPKNPIPSMEQLMIDASVGVEFAPVVEPFIIEEDSDDENEEITDPDEIEMRAFMKNLENVETKTSPTPTPTPPSELGVNEKTIKFEATEKELIAITDFLLSLKVKYILV